MQLYAKIAFFEENAKKKKKKIAQKNAVLRSAYNTSVNPNEPVGGRASEPDKQLDFPQKHTPLGPL